MSSVLISQCDTTPTTQISNNKSLHEGQGWNRAEIEAIDLKEFRNSNLIGANYVLLLLIPVVGWIALACLKGYYVIKHRSAEHIMTTKHFDTLIDADEKIAVITEAIQVSGPHAWQYRLELARLRLLQGEFRKAADALEAVREQKGASLHLRDVRDVGLVSFQPAGVSLDSFQPVGRGGEEFESVPVPRKFVLKINYDGLYEALLAAAVFAANQEYVRAYDAYNEVIYYSRNLASNRRHQRALAVNMSEDERFSPVERCKQIIQDEENFETRKQQARDSENKGGPLFSFPIDPMNPIDWSEWKFDVEIVQPDHLYAHKRYEVKLLLTPRLACSQEELK